MSENPLSNRPKDNKPSKKSNNLYWIYGLILLFLFIAILTMPSGGSRENMDRKKFLDTIRMIETSGGTNLEHPEIKTGAYKGQTAMGEYGILPPTLKEFLNRRKFAGTYGPDEAIMSQMRLTQLLCVVTRGLFCTARVSTAINRLAK